MRTSSKGNQYKFQKNGYWYKADYLGYESLAECLTVSLLKGSKQRNFAAYELERRKIGNQICIAEIRTRVKEIVRAQMRRYRYLCENNLFAKAINMT